MSATSTPAEGANIKPAAEGAHDRVAMLSLRADGTPDQLNPEIIGDKDAAIAAAKRQFAEQAVSAQDVAERGVSAGGADEVKQDPTVADLQKKHEKTEAAAEKRAEQVVNDLHKG